MQYMMSLDQGTTSSRCILFDRNGKICSMAQKEFEQIYLNPGWVEHDAEEIWDSTLEVSREAMTKLGVSAKDIAGIGITNQRETTILWDRETGKPVCNAIVWQCRRTSEMVDELIEKGYGDMIRRKTGLVPDAYFSGTKIRWILDHVPGVRERAEKGEILFGTVDTWLIWKLTGGAVHVTDYTNASRTMLYNIHELCWDPELLEMLDIPPALLPKVKPSSNVYGKTVFDLYQGEIPVAGAAGDQQSALFGQCGFEPGDLKNTYGTGCFLLMNTGKKPVQSQNGLITTIAAGVDEKVSYALEGSVFVAGAAIQWLRDELGVIASAAESESYAEQAEDSLGAYVVPAFTGLGAPYWNQNARGAILGLTRGFSRAHLVRAVLESLAYQTYDVCRAMERDAGMAMQQTLKVDGGASANNFLMQFQSDLLQVKVQRPVCVETTALGAAYLAGIAVGYWENLDDIKGSWSVGREFVPRMGEEKRLQCIRGWEKAVKCAMDWVE